MRNQTTQQGRDPARRRVLTVLHTPFLEGGAEKVAVDLALSLDRSRFEASFCALKTTTQPTREPDIRAEGLAYTPLGLRTIRAPRGFAAFVRLLRRERIDIVHAHLWDANLWAALAAPLARFPVLVAHEHTWSYEGRPLRVATDRHVISRISSAMVCVSEYDRRKMVEIEKIPFERIRVLPNGIPPLAPLTGHDLRAELGIPTSSPLVGAVAVARRQKRLDVLLEAVAQLNHEFPDVHLAIAGSGGSLGELPALERQAMSLGIRDRVHFLGLRSDIPDLLAAFDAACLSSDFEGQPLSVMEYMAAGKPIVSTKVGGLPEMIRDGVEGLLVPRRDPTALAAALKRLLLDRSAAAAMGAAARERQVKEFSLDAAVARVEALYDETWEKASRRRA